MNYRFDIHHYGPFCDDILRDVEWLIADGVIVDRADNSQRHSDYAPGGTMEELLATHKDSIEQFREKVRSVVRALVPMRPERLELIATAEDEAYRRGIEGVEEGIRYKGERVGTEMKYSDTVLLAILNAGKPQKYKYRSDTAHDLSPAMQVVFQRLEQLSAIHHLPSAPSTLPALLSRA
jgi:hypothetical protein